jgi:hypothetical protein
LLSSSSFQTFGHKFPQDCSKSTINLAFVHNLTLRLLHILSAGANVGTNLPC